MPDKTTKSLLVAIVALLCLLLAHDFAGGTLVQAQSSVAVAQPQPVMSTDNNVVYVLQNGTLSAYILDSPTLEKGLPGVLKQKLRLFSSLKVHPTP